MGPLPIGVGVGVGVKVNGRVSYAVALTLSDQAPLSPLAGTPRT